MGPDDPADSDPSPSQRRRYSFDVESSEPGADQATSSSGHFSFLPPPLPNNEPDATRPPSARELRRQTGAPEPEQHHRPTFHSEFARRYGVDPLSPLSQRQAEIRQQDAAAQPGTDGLREDSQDLPLPPEGSEGAQPTPNQQIPLLIPDAPSQDVPAPIEPESIEPEPAPVEPESIPIIHADQATPYTPSSLRYHQDWNEPAADAGQPDMARPHAVSPTPVPPPAAAAMPPAAEPQPFIPEAPVYPEDAAAQPEPQDAPDIPPSAPEPEPQAQAFIPQPAVPAQPTMPAQPAQPEPAEPAVPTQPVEPAQPAQPAAPVEPAVPVQPAAPAQPAEDVLPGGVDVYTVEPTTDPVAQTRVAAQQAAPGAPEGVPAEQVAATQADALTDLDSEGAPAQPATEDAAIAAAGAAVPAAVEAEPIQAPIPAEPIPAAAEAVAEPVPADATAAAAPAEPLAEPAPGEPAAQPTEPAEPATDQPKRPLDTFSEADALASDFRPRTAVVAWKKFTDDQLQRFAILASVIIAALIRLIDLGGVDRIAFDETYYVKDAYSLWHLGYEGQWADNVNDAFQAGDYSGLSTQGAFIVHPQVGKWLLGFGPQMFGWQHPWAWRIMPALAGIVVVLMTCLIARKLFDSPLMTLMTGLFMAVDGVAVSVSRIALLDVFAAMFLTAGFYTFLLDQFDYHRRLAAFMHENRGDLSVKEKVSVWRPWLVATAVLWGLAGGVKWNAIYVIAFGGIFLFVREITMRYGGGMRGKTLIGRAIVRGGIPAFLQLVPVAILVYLASWWSWFAHPNAYGHGGTGKGALADFWKFQVDTMHFHTGVTSPHRYQANALQWILDLRPTSMMWLTSNNSDGTEIVRASTTIGNPFMWWLGVAAMLFLIIIVFWLRDWRAGFILLGYASLWLPWFLYWNRTIFMFYTIVLVPFVALAVVYLLGTFSGSVTPKAWPMAAWEYNLKAPTITVSRNSTWIAVGLAAVIILCGVFFLPVTAAWPIPRSHWDWRMWLQSWI